MKTDRQQPLEVNADSTDGTLGDGLATLKGQVEIRQGTLHIQADEAEVSKVEGRVHSVTFRGSPASLEQEIEEQGHVRATASEIAYQVANGLVTLTGNADDPASALFTLSIMTGLVMVILGMIRGPALHPMHWFFISAAFFAFHLLLAYLVDHVNVHLAFALAAATSVFLVVSYLRLVAGTRGGVKW